VQQGIVNAPLIIPRAAIARGMRPSPQQLYGQFGWP